MQPIDRVGYAEYLASSEQAEQKLEYVDGRVLAMSGGTIEHSRLAANMILLLGTGLREGPCRVFSSDGRVRIEETNRSTYPDASVVCGEVERASDDPQAIANPKVLVEVLSDSTEQDDRGAKFAHYRRLRSLEEYVLVSQHEPRVEVFRRTEGGWLLIESGPGERVRLESIGVEFLLDELFRDAIPGRPS